jgi:hypothetical protein
MAEEMHLARSDNAHLDARFDEIMAELRQMNGAFAKNPDGTVDYDGHRRYHEQMIAAAEAQTEFWRELRLDIAKKGIWGLLIIVVGLIMVGISAKLGIGTVK